MHGLLRRQEKAHGTDKAIVAGLLGMKTDDIRIPQSFEVAKEEDMAFSIENITLKDAHPNTAVLHILGKHGREIEMQASSVGGGSIMVNKIDGIDVNFSGQNPTLVVHNVDQPGHVATVAAMLSQREVNISSMQLYRHKKGDYAVMVIETDQDIPDTTIAELECLEGILKVTYFGGME